MAIQNSSEIQAIEERLDLADDRVGYQRSQQWTNYLTLDPMQLIQNLLGGGAVQRNEIAIAELEMRAADLIRRRQEVAEGLGRDIILLVSALGTLRAGCGIARLPAADPAAAGSGAGGRVSNRGRLHNFDAE